MKYVKGNLLEMARMGDFQVIGHGCNCFCTMGAGIAKQVRAEAPDAYVVDCKTQYGDKGKLGTYSGSIIKPDSKFSNAHEYWCLNLYTQHKYTRTEVDVDYDAIRGCMKEIAKTFGKNSIGLPLIGAGLAGGDWETIEAIIEEELHGLDVTIVVWEKDEENLKKFGL